MQRRKTLRNALSSLAAEAKFHVTAVDPQVQGETLTVADCVRLTDAVGATAIRGSPPEGGAR